MNYQAGIYVRLSRDDERLGESMSIENQKLLLTNYVQDQGWEIVDTYSDDGFTGTNFERPALKRMIEDVKNKRINLVIVKDLSRFGRNYIQVGQFTDYVFPSVGCRFIALNDQVDTLNSENDMMPFKNLFNEMYSRDIGKKVVSAKKIRAKNGKYMCAYAPMGYIKNPDNPSSLLIDEGAAPIIRRIFAMRRQGLGYRGIAALLNEEKRLPPRDYYYQQLGKENPRKTTHTWSDIVVREILRNEVYIGNVVQFKTGVISFKNHKIIDKPEESWIRCENVHEALIDRETWEIVQSLGAKSKTYRTNSSGEVSLFSGLLECADCGSSMKFIRDCNRRKDGSRLNHHAYICCNYSKGGAHACSPHRTMEWLLTDLVKRDIKKQSERILNDEDTVVRELMRHRNASDSSKRDACERQLRSAKQRLAELDRLIAKSYEEMVSGEIPRDILLGLLEKYQSEKREAAELVDELTQQLAQSQESERDIRTWTGLMKRNMAVEEIDRALLMRLIDKIVVGQKREENGVDCQDITIIYNLVGRVE